MLRLTNIDSAKELQLLRADKILGRQVFAFDTCDSTNLIALELLQKGAAHGTLVVSNEQSEGRGRNKKVWITRAGSTALSLVFRAHCNPLWTSRITTLSALAIWEALHLLDIPTLIKWPNDIVMKAQPRQKVCGILVEGLSKAHAICAVIGIGINVERPEHFPQELAPNACFLSDFGFKVQRTLLLQSVLDSLELRLNRLDDTGFTAALGEVRKQSLVLGKWIEWQEGQHNMRGYAEDLNPDASLLVKLENGAYQSLYAGEVSLPYDRIS